MLLWNIVSFCNVILLYNIMLLYNIISLCNIILLCDIILLCARTNYWLVSIYGKCMRSLVLWEELLSSFS